MDFWEDVWILLLLILMLELINRVGKFYSNIFDCSIGKCSDLVLKMFQEALAIQASMDSIYTDIKLFTPLENGAV